MEWLRWFAAWYLLPAHLADMRRHPRRRAIRRLTTWTGWTGVGWLAALVWAESG